MYIPVCISLSINIIQVYASWENNILIGSSSYWNNSVGMKDWGSVKS